MPPALPAAAGTRNFTCKDGQVDKSYMIANVTFGDLEVRNCTRNLVDAVDATLRGQLLLPQ